MVLPDETIQKEIIAAYQNGGKVKDILKQFGIGYNEFWKIREQSGVEVREGGLLRRVLSPEQESQIAEEYINGSSARELAIKYDIDRSVISRILKQKNIQMHSVAEFNVKKTFPEEQICDFYKTNKNENLSSAAKKFNTTTYSVKKILIKHGIELRFTPNPFSKRKQSRLLPIKDTIVRLYNEGLSISKIRDIVGVKTGTVQYMKLLRQEGCIIRTIGEQNIQYKINDRYFSSIDSPEKAYILGLLYTDGSLRLFPRKKVTLELHINDVDTVNFVKKSLNSNRPLSFTKKNSVIFATNSIQIVDDLVKLGVIHNKTKILDFPKCVPSVLMPHFLHGVLDGDGWVCSTEDNTFVGICSGAQNFFKGLEKELVNLDIAFKSRTDEANNHRLEFTTNTAKIKFLNLVYKNAPMIMKRKFLEYEKLTKYDFRKNTIDQELISKAQNICSELRLKFATIL